jgi:hypothetical protein
LDKYFPASFLPLLDKCFNFSASNFVGPRAIFLGLLSYRTGIWSKNSSIWQHIGQGNIISTEELASLERPPRATNVQQTLAWIKRVFYEKECAALRYPFSLLKKKNRK